jgi:hypothetical protein
VVEVLPGSPEFLQLRATPPHRGGRFRLVRRVRRFVVWRRDRRIRLLGRLTIRFVEPRIDSSFQDFLY